MRVILALYLLVLGLFCICNAGDNFWKSLEALTQGNKDEAVTHFLQTGRLPSEKVSPERLDTELSSVEQHHSAPWFGTMVPTDFVGHASSSGAVNTNPMTSSEVLSGVSLGHLASDSHPAHNVLQTAIAATDHTRRLPPPPPPLSLDERQRILEKIANTFTRHSHPHKEALVRPYKGQKLTTGLIEESFGAALTRLREFEPVLYLMRGRSDDSPPIFTLMDGGMLTERDRDRHVYVFQRFAAGGQGSIFRLVGLIESGLTPLRAFRPMRTYITGRADLKALGTDSLIDHSALMLATSRGSS